MPLPKPNKNEKEKDFISRCMGDPVMVKDYPDNKQRSAVCYSQWRKREMQILFVPIELKDDDLVSHLFLYTGNFEHGLYGKFDIKTEHLKNAVENFNNKIGVKFDEKGKSVLPVNYNHSKMGTAEQGKMAGLIREIYLDGRKLMAKIWFTDEARERIGKKEYMWISPEFDDKFKDENGKEHGFTAVGMGLTNIPFLRSKQHAIKLSEEGFEDFDDLKEWDTEYINNLPDSAFAVIGSGGSKDKDGKTVPRNLRSLPYKNSSGEIDIPHLRNALARLDQTKLSPADKSKAKAVLVKAAKQVGVGDYSEYEEFLQGDQSMKKLDEQIRELFGLKEEDNIVESLKTLKESSEKINKIDEIEKQVKQLTDDKTELEKKNKELQEKVDQTGDKVVLTKEKYEAMEEGMKKGQKALKMLEDRDAIDAVEKDIKAGKVHPKQRDSMVKLAIADRKLYNDTIASMEEGSVNFTEKGDSGSGDEDGMDSSKRTELIEARAKEKKITFTEARDQIKIEQPELFK